MAEWPFKSSSFYYNRYPNWIDDKTIKIVDKTMTILFNTIILEASDFSPIYILNSFIYLISSLTDRPDPPLTSDYITFSTISGYSSSNFLSSITLFNNSS